MIDARAGWEDRGTAPPGSWVPDEGEKAPNLPGVDLVQFSRWAAGNLPGAPVLRGASMLSGGHSNINVRLDFPGRSLVLRRPPLGHVMQSAHDVEREYRVLLALQGTSVPTPAPVASVGADAVGTGVGAPFVLTEFVGAQSLQSRADNAGMHPAVLRSASENLARVLAILHSIDPREVDLGTLGKPEGYNARQLRRWAAQLESSRSRQTPDLDRLIATIPEPPNSQRASIVHGDFKLNNALLAISGSEAQIAAVLDWELATLGDPYTDLAMFGTYWDMPSVDPAIAAGFESPVDLAVGYPTFDTLLGIYEEASGVSLPDMRWYRAFAALKISVITESLHYRHHIGAARGAGFERMGDMTEPIARIGLEALRHRKAPARRQEER